MNKNSGSTPWHSGWTKAASLLFGVLFLVVAFSAQSQAQQADKKIPNEQLEQLVAPIALYPDSLMAQVLMASTYPLEVVQADRWAKENPKLTGKALEDKLATQPWDASVKSVVAVPQVLTMMSEKIDWTQKLGDAFLAQQEDVLSAVQRLRVKAEDKGTLKTTSQQKVSKQTTGGKTAVVIEPADPEVVYVPSYDPAVVYGDWPYPAYPPYAWYPPGYIGSNLISFGLGVAAGGALWGNCNWGNNNVNIDIDRYNNFNRDKINHNNWNHDASHRKGVPYANQRVAERNGKGVSNTAAREQFRGRAESGDLGLGDRQSGARPEQRDKSAANRDKAASRDTAGSRDKAASRDKAGGGAKKPSGGADRAGTRDKKNSQAFNGVGNGAEVRRQSDRGNASRQGSQMQHRAAARPSGGGGFSRGGGGGGRVGGGGGRGGGGRGGGRR